MVKSLLTRPARQASFDGLLGIVALRTMRESSIGLSHLRRFADQRVALDSGMPSIAKLLATNVP
jgi:hypothetical protein